MFDKRVQSLYVMNPILEEKEVVFYGAGETAHTMYRNLVRSGKVKLLAMYERWFPEGGTIFGNVPLLTRKEFEELNRDIPIIIASKKHRVFIEMATDLISLGFNNIITSVWPSLPMRYEKEYVQERYRNARDRIDIARGLFADESSIEVFDSILKYRVTNDVSLFVKIVETKYKQYFPVGEIFDPEEKEILIDGGSLNALSIRDFKEWSKDKYYKVYAFEPSVADKQIVDEYIRFEKYRAVSVEAGLYNFNGTVDFSTEELGLSSIVEEGDTKINVVKLDDFMQDKNEKVTFIKMDIEGSEMEALEGCIETINRDHPKLAICVYHKFDDLWEIPLWIHERFPKYKFWLRHHSLTNNETVVYARWDS